MTDIKEEDQIPYKFYNELDVMTNPSRLDGLNARSIINLLCSNSTVKTLLAKIHRNIELIRTDYSDSSKKRCRDVNFWTDEYIERNKSNTEFNKEVTICLTTLFNEVKWKKQDQNGICKREKSVYKTNITRLRKDLDDFCEIRNSLRCTMLKGFNECLKYNNYIQKKKDDFLGKKNLCEGNSCIIDEKCTLADMDITFPSINCHELHNLQKLDQKESITTKYSSLEIGFFLIISFLTFFLISLFLYKMTPFGSLLRNYLSRKNIIKEKMNGEKYEELFQYSFNSEAPYSGSREYFVNYSSLPN
ncbi:PIR protein [Plasmodium ovale]|uniref:PIR Superfamily Protein n=2 Tax=Plasmodium ovale TaxID=36330 RepID=A0A1A8X4U6_PLAOA|nr:PIR Superfamily Protein [Plasmodium ovale curtisi]SBT83324.1 PIR protein [Plasmodium ovale]